MKITAARLRRRGLCEKEIKRFESIWPHGAMPTEYNLAVAEAKGLLWLHLEDLLPEDVYEDYYDLIYPINGKLIREMGRGEEYEALRRAVLSSYLMEAR